MQVKASRLSNRFREKFFLNKDDMVSLEEIERSIDGTRRFIVKVNGVEIGVAYRYELPARIV